ncbi:MAG: SDR family oxidoreductase [Mycobacteriales bacterium]
MAESTRTRERPVTIVTGASKGIGAATARRLAADGHDVVVGYFGDEAGARGTSEAITAAGGTALALRADVTTEDGVATLFGATIEQFGTPTGLVNNAGATLHIGDLAETPVDVVRHVLDLNLLSVVLCCRRAAQVMPPRFGGNGGAILNISSAAATLGSAHEYVHYAAAKAGVDALTVGLAAELAGDGVRVNAVAAGIVRTGIHAAAGDPGRVDRAGAAVPLWRAGEVAEIAAAVAFLLGPDSSYTTGAILRVAGGR